MIEIPDRKATVAISFDYETSANSHNIVSSNIVMKNILQLRNFFLKDKKDISLVFGRGYSNRIGTENIISVFQKYKIHGTWFSTGHVLLKENIHRNNYRIHKQSSYPAIFKGLNNINNPGQPEHPVFMDDPAGDYKTHPYWYFGDQAQRLREMGEDIQCHTFSHPYVALEAVENLQTDLEDWQKAAARNGFEKATVLAFPYLGDCYIQNKITGETGMFRNLTEKNPEAFDILPLSGKHIDILKSAGIELVTRCISWQMKNDFLFGGIREYNYSGLYYMPDINFSMPEFNNLAFKTFLGEVIVRHATLNIWLHPNNVFRTGEIRNFEKMVCALKEESDKGNIWLATMKEIWEKFKTDNNLRKLSL